MDVSKARAPGAGENRGRVERTTPTKPYKGSEKPCPVAGIPLEKATEEIPLKKDLLQLASRVQAAINREARL